MLSLTGAVEPNTYVRLLARLDASDAYEGTGFKITITHCIADNCYKYANDFTWSEVTS